MEWQGIAGKTKIKKRSGAKCQQAWDFWDKGENNKPSQRLLRGLANFENRRG